MNNESKEKLLADFKNQLVKLEAELEGISKSFNVKEVTNPRIAQLKREMYLLNKKIKTIERMN